MRCLIYTFVLSLLMLSCSTKEGSKSFEDSTTNLSENEVISDSTDLNDSLIIWVNREFENKLKEDISICDCWREIKYHFLYYDTVKMELYLKSNLMHYGHDSELIFPLKRFGNRLKNDTTSQAWPTKNIEFNIPVNDTIRLMDGDEPYTFVKRVFKYEKDTSQKYFFVYSKLSDIHYILNSYILMKYNVVDAAASSHHLIDLPELKQLVLNQKVSAHCSDDYYYDGITIKTDESRYYFLEFEQGMVSLFEFSNRNRYEKLNLDTLPKQVIIVQ